MRGETFCAKVKRESVDSALNLKTFGASELQLKHMNTWTNERSWWRGGYNQPLWLCNSKRGMRLARRYGRGKDSVVWHRAFSASRYNIQGGYTCTWRRGLILVQGKAFPLMRPLSKVKWIPRGLSGGGTTKKEGENQYMGTTYYCTLKGQTTPLRPGAVWLNLSKE